MCNPFGTTNKTQQSTQSQQTGSTTNPLANTLLQYGQNNVSSQYSPSNISATAAGLGANQYQTGAANNQSALTQSATGTFNAASNMAQNGVNPSSIQQWMNPYTQNVIDAFNRQADITDGRTLAQAQGSNALAGGLTNSAARGNMDYLRSNLAANRNSQAANLYNQGYNTATSNTFQNAGIQNQAANTVSGLLNSQSNANATLGQLGNSVYGATQNQLMTPYNLTSQGASTLSGLSSGVGSTSTGTSTGTSSGTTDQSQGWGTIGAGLLGSYFMGRRASGGSVFPRFEGHDAGLHDRLASTVQALRGVFRSEGGAIPRFEGGGTVRDWQTTVEPAMPKFSGTTNVPVSPESPFPSYGPVEQALPAYAGATDKPQSAGFFDGFKSVLPSYDHGVWAGEKATPSQRLGMALTQIGMNNPFAGFGKAAMDQSNIEEQRRQQKEFHDKQLAQAAQIAMGELGGRPTLAAQQLEESRRQHDKPTWGVIGQNEFGQNTYGWINPNLAPNFSGRTPGAASVMPSEPTPSSVIPGNAAPGFKGGDMSKTGNEFLASLDDSTAKLVKGIAEGRVQPPGSFALSKPYWQHMTRMVSQYDPTFDATNWSARSKTAADFSAGKSAQNITSFNTAIGHLDSLHKSIDGLNNSRFPWWNSLSQSARVQGGDAKYAAALKEFNTAKTAVTDELVRAFRGSGGNVHDVIQWEKNINAADSPEALKKAVSTGIELLRSRIEAMGDTYNRGMGASKDLMSWLSPKARHALERMETDGRASDAAEQKGVTQGHAVGPGVPKASTDRLPDNNQPVTRRVINKRTGQEETLVLENGEWKRAAQ